MTFPFLPIPADKPNGMSFVHTQTGETFHFDDSWRTALDKVERILWKNHFGGYYQSDVGHTVRA